MWTYGVYWATAPTDMAHGKLLDFLKCFSLLSFPHIYCWYASNQMRSFHFTPTNATESERHVIQFPLHIIVVIGRYRNALQTYGVLQHCFVVKNNSIGAGWFQGTKWMHVVVGVIYCSSNKNNKSLTRFFFFFFLTVHHLNANGFFIYHPSSRFFVLWQRQSVASLQRQKHTCHVWVSIHF